jgi:hypothetical protein
LRAHSELEEHDLYEEIEEFNPIKALGIIPSGDQDEEDVVRVLELWGPDPVHQSN